jgi:hypothetical protein
MRLSLTSSNSPSGIRRSPEPLSPEVSEDLSAAMKVLAVSTLDESRMLQTRGW